MPQNEDLPLSDLTAAQRGQLLQHLRRKNVKKIRENAITRADRGNIVLASFGQQRLWFLNQLNPDDPSYNWPACVRFNGHLEVAVLERSLNEIIRRHEILRTTFDTINDVLMQAIAAHFTLNLPIIDLQHLSEDEREIEVQRRASAAAQAPFDLSQDLPWRATLLCLSPTDYVLLVFMHHIIADGWSAGILIHELVTLYSAFITGQSSPLPELTIQYADFTLWQHQWLQGEILDRQLNYWKQQLSGQLPILELPNDHPRGAARTFRGDILSFGLPNSVVSDLKNICRKQDATLFMGLLAAFTILLSRYARQEDILVGTPIANRNRMEIEPLIGFFINTLVLRNNLSGDPTFSEYLDRVRNACLGAYNHQDLPFEKLVKELNIKRGLNQDVLFQVMFALDNTPDLYLDIVGLRLSSVEFSRDATQFDLSLVFRETEKAFLGTIEYNTDIFAPVTIQRMQGHFEQILAGIIAQPTARIHALPLLTLDEYRTAVGWNRTLISYPSPICLPEALAAQVEKNPDAVALVYEGVPLTYREFNARANQLAHYLIAQGVGPDVLVGICAERSIELVIGICGILKAGGAYVPIDPGYPSERLTFILEDAHIRLLLTQQHLVPKLPTNLAQRICLDADWPTIAEGPITNPTSGVTSDNLAYVIYTSGSTGRPKGVMSTHQGIINRLLWMQNECPLTVDDRVLQKTPFSFDVSVWELFWPLIAGARLTIARPEGHKDSSYLVDIIQQEQITIIHFVPSMLQIFLEDPGAPRCISLRRVICSGEALSYELQEYFFTVMNAALHNLYGPTEASVEVTHWACERSSARKIVPIGYPIANTQMYVLDKYLQPVPIGVPGDLYIGGVQLARGYLNRPDLTAERFIPNPFIDGGGSISENRLTAPSLQSKEPPSHMQYGSRLYCTGDLARCLSDGAIEFLGREDYQVKIRGFRVELGEIEAILRQHSSVHNAIVVAHEDKGHTRLIGYIVSDTKAAALSSELRRMVQERLPEYMMPATFVFLDSLPLSANGKVARASLPIPEQSRPDLDSPLVIPYTQIQEILATIWCQMLGIDQLGIYDNFFDVGGDSLLALQIMGRMQKAFGVTLSLRDMIGSPTIAEIGAIIEKKQGILNIAAAVGSDHPNFVAIQRHGTKVPLFLVHGQSGGIHMYHELAQHLGDEQPIYGIEAQAYKEDVAPFSRIEDMAASYVEAITSYQAHGPYRIGGWSMGGVIAFEMARQLYERGISVDFVIMLDSNAPTGENNQLAIAKDPITKIVQFLLAEFALVDWVSTLDFNIIRQLSSDEQLFYLENSIFYSAVQNDTTDKLLALLRNQHELRRRVEVFSRHEQALANYRPTLHPAQRIIYFRTIEQNLAIWPSNRQPEMHLSNCGWEDFTSKAIEPYFVPGNHITVLHEPNIQIVGEWLKQHVLK
jgi:amino acid adenylation domain-containing protein